MNYDERYIFICNAIERALRAGKRDFIIYPFGMNGMMTKRILNERYLIQEKMLVDNRLCDFRADVKITIEMNKSSPGG